MALESKEITMNDRGVFVKTTKRVHWRHIISRRRTLENRILSLQEKIIDFQRDLGETENELKDLNKPVVDLAIKHEKELEKDAEKKAIQIFKEVVGEKIYNQIQDKGTFKFQAKDGRIYKIDKQGRIFRKTEKEGFKRLCIIRPKYLPLPDFIVSLLLNVKNHPMKYQLARGR